MADRPLPPYDAIPAAWARLSPEVQAGIGRLAIEKVFAEFVAGDAYAHHDRLCNVVIREEAQDRAIRLAAEIEWRLEAALPYLFGLDPDDTHPDGLDPPWAWRDEGELAAVRDDVDKVYGFEADPGRKAVDIRNAIDRRRRDLAFIAALRPAPAPAIDTVGNREAVLEVLQLANQDDVLSDTVNEIFKRLAPVKEPA